MARHALSNRDQKANESPAEFAAALGKMVNKAYKTEEGYTETMKKDITIDSFLKDSEAIRSVLTRQSRSTTIAAAISTAQNKEII